MSTTAFSTKLNGLELDTLAFVNKVRTEFGMPTIAELPEGRPGNPTQCVVARALSNGWKASVGSSATMRKPRKWRRSDLVKEIPLTIEVREFIMHFDNGAYPQLIANRYDI